MSRYGQPFTIPTPSPGLFDLHDRALPLSIREILVIFNRELRSDDTQSPLSVTNPSNWTIVPVDPRITKDDGTFQIPDGESVPQIAEPQIAFISQDSDFDDQYVLTTVTPMEDGVRYTLTLSDNVKSTGCDALSSNDSAEVKAITRGLPREPRFVQEDTYRDFALTYFPTDPKQPNATWRFDSTSDIGIQSAAESLKKRLYRRLTTQPGAFRHLGEGYGVKLRLKTLFRSGRAQELANEVARQCRLEPDVADAGATAKLRVSGSGSFVDVSVKFVREDRKSGRFVMSLGVE